MNFFFTILALCISTLSFSQKTYEIEDYLGTTLMDDGITPKGENKGVALQTTNAGYTGKGYADYGGKGTYVQLNDVKVAKRKEGDYTITIRYASRGVRNTELYVNGLSQGSSFTNIYGNSFKEYKTQSYFISLKEGYNILKLVADGDGPNVDNFVITKGIEE